MRRVLVSAGDPSGDLILAGIIRGLRALPGGDTTEFVGLCGPASEREGVKVVASSKDVAVVGIFEVIKNLSKIFGALESLKREIANVDSVLCVDFPDFNLRLAEMAFKQGKPVDYVIAPQVWAWRHGRIPKMTRIIRRLYPALPFEEQLFNEAGLKTKFLGHPIRDLLPPKARRDARAEIGAGPDERIFCLMPGSRKIEIERHLPLLIDAWDQFTALEARALSKVVNRAVLPLAPGWTREAWFERIGPKHAERLRALEASGAWRITDDSRRSLMAADFGWIVSGTATLEAALYMVPHILVYKLSSLSAFFVKALSNYFSDTGASAGLPNILLGKAVIPELLQGRVSPRQLAVETFELLRNQSRLNDMEKSLRYLPKKLGDPGATRRIAEDLRALWG